MEVLEAQTETKLMSLEDAAAKLGISTRQLRTIRNEVEEVLGKRIVTPRIEQGKRFLYLTSEAFEMLETWRDCKDPISFLTKYASGPKATYQDDWSFIREEVQEVEAEIIESSEDVAIVAILPSQLSITDRSNQIQNLITQIVCNELQQQANQQQRQQVDLDQIREDAKLQFLKRKAAEQAAEMEMQQALERAAEAAKKAVTKGGKSSKSFR